MAKKILMALVLLVLTVGGAFAQTDFVEKANTVTVDLGPTIAGMCLGATAVPDVSVSPGFGIAIQYERQTSEKISLAGRFACLAFGWKQSGSIDDHSYGVDSTNVDIDISSFSIEGHVRYYPWGEAFFLDGMIGYGNMSVRYFGTMVGIAYNQEVPMGVNVQASQDFFKLGAKVGWRISFGKNSGFTFEPALGYSVAIGLGDTLDSQFSKQTANPLNIIIPDQDLSGIAPIMVGGFRVVLALGYRF